MTVRGCAREAVYGSSSSRKRLESSSRRGSNHGKRKRKRAWSKPAAYLTRTSKGKFAPSKAARATATPCVLRLVDCSQDSSARRRLAGHPSDVQAEGGRGEDERARALGLRVRRIGHGQQRGEHNGQHDGAPAGSASVLGCGLA